MKKDIKLITTLLFVLSVLCMPISVLGADVYTHDQTGIILPHKIADHKFKGKDVYEEEGLGEAVSYGHESATATIYIYDYNRNDIKDDSKHSLIMEELSNTTMALKKLQEMGTYEDVKISKEGRVSGKNGQFVFISIPVTYNAVKSSRTGEKIPPQAVSSMISIGIYKNHFIKIRYSFPHIKQEDLKKKYEQRDAFINEIIKLVLDVDIRGQMKKVISAYLKDPYNEEIKKALKVVVVFVKKSPLIEITIGTDIISLLNIKDYPYWKDLLESYIIGQTIYQLSNDHYEHNHKAGLDQVLKDYILLKNKNQNAELQPLEELLKKQ